MLAAALAAMAMTAAVMGVIVGMLVAMGVVVSVLMGMGVVMFMVVAAAGDVIVMNMHMVSPLHFFFYYTCGTRFCQNIYFWGNIPPSGLHNHGKTCIMKRKIVIYLTYERRYGNVPRAYA
jgi:hypothetical protein